MLKSEVVWTEETASSCRWAFSLPSWGSSFPKHLFLLKQRVGLLWSSFIRFKKCHWKENHVLVSAPRQFMEGRPDAEHLAQQVFHCSLSQHGRLSFTSHSFPSLLLPRVCEPSSRGPRTHFPPFTLQKPQVPTSFWSSECYLSFSVSTLQFVLQSFRSLLTATSLHISKFVCLILTNVLLACSIDSND